MGCSGTPYEIVDAATVGRFVSVRAGELPPSEIETILGEVLAGRALAFIGPEGVIVITLTPRGDSIELLVLLAVSTGAPGAFKRQEAAVCAIARDLGANAVAFKPYRRGWKRLVGPEWIMRGALFVRFLDGRPR